MNETKAPSTEAVAEKHEKKAPKQENMLLNLALNIVVPTIILTKYSGESHLGPQLGIIIALAFPILYGVFDFFRAQKINVFSALGVFSIALTGGISLLQLDPKYIAIKEAAIPGLLGLATLISLKTKYPLVRTFLYNDKILQVDKIANALKQHNQVAAFDRTLSRASLMVAGSFFLSSALNYGLAKYILISPPGTEAFNSELGKMTALSFPVITIPAMTVLMFALFYLFRSVKKLTGLPFEELLNGVEEPSKEK